MRKGSSGSPLLNENREVVGIVPNGSNNVGANVTERSKTELAFAFKFTGYVRQEIDKNSY